MIRELYERVKHRYRLWRYPPRPMVGLWATLTPEQRDRILANRDDV